MKKSRQTETYQGIQEELTVQDFDQMARHHRDKGYTDIKSLINNDLISGKALEIGSGPGYIGLEWLKMTNNTSLVGLEISKEMIKIANKNVAEYGFEERITYVYGDATQIFPFEENSFDVVFSFSSLHEWKSPESVFSEVYRVLKPNGKFLVSDLRRDISFLFRFIMRFLVKEKAMKAGFDTSIAAAYTTDELSQILNNTKLKNSNVHKTPFGLYVIGEKL